MSSPRGAWLLSVKSFRIVRNRGLFIVSPSTEQTRSSVERHDLLLFQQKVQHMTAANMLTRATQVAQYIMIAAAPHTLKLIRELREQHRVERALRHDAAFVGG